MTEYRNLGFLAAVPRPYAVQLRCDHCKVTWAGCMDESFCPECHAPKGYYPHDLNECYCPKCKPVTDARYFGP